MFLTSIVTFPQLIGNRNLLVAASNALSLGYISEALFAMMVAPSENFRVSMSVTLLLLCSKIGLGMLLRGFVFL